MKSYLISALSKKFGAGELAAFEKAHPHDWLLWEPGAWRPAQPTTILVQTPAPRAAAGEALALALEPASPERPQVTFGRGPESELQINDGTLSQLHLVFMKSPSGSWTVRDAQSKNGSRVGDWPLMPGVPVALRDGAPITAAQVALTFYTPAGLFARLRK